jgi:7,8-dihydro-6-hydroxymethylpterin-pyrophosphokinase
MTEVYIALGSNLGDRLKNLENAVRVLSDKIEDIKVSFFYET